MGKHHLPPQTTLRRYKDGSGWYLEAVGEDGVPENVGDFTVGCRGARLDHSQICCLFQRAHAIVCRRGTAGVRETITMCEDDLDRGFNKEIRTAEQLSRQILTELKATRSAKMPMAWSSCRGTAIQRSPTGASTILIPVRRSRSTWKWHCSISCRLCSRDTLWPSDVRAAQCSLPPSQSRKNSVTELWQAVYN